MLRTLRRLIKILTIVIYYGLDREIIPKFLSPSIVLRVFPNIREKQDKSLGERLFESCVALGPLFIKFGQLISIRHDLFSKSIVEPLSQLQDNVPFYDSKIAIHTIESSLNQSLKELFLAFDTTPIASASIAQVYQATLHNKDHVVVKVIRPNIHRELATDLRLLRFLSGIVSLCTRWSYRSFQRLIDEYAYTLKQELDLSKEGSHYSQMRHYFKNDDRLYIPRVYWQYTHTNVLTLEKINGTPIDEISDKDLINRKILAENGVSIFFTQIFKYRFFHADMHPGNVFIIEGNPPRYAAVDFGIVGSISPHDQYYLVESFLAFHQRDYYRVAKLYIEAFGILLNSVLKPRELLI